MDFPHIPAGPPHVGAILGGPQIQPATPMHGRVSACFNIPLADINGIPEGDLLNIVVVDNSNELLENPFNCLTSEKIQEVAGLFTDLHYEIGDGPVNPIDPPSGHVFLSLNNCIARLEPHNDFGAAIAARDHAFQTDNTFTQILPVLGLNIPAALAQLEILHISEEDRAQIRQNLLACPVYTARDWFGGHNIHDTYILRSPEPDGTCQWVFKPTVAEGMVIGEPDHTTRECTAYAVNSAKNFPIPATYFVNIKGHQGSVQLFIENSFNEIGAQANHVSPLDLQKLLIFDLLFSNLDRHGANYLFSAGDNAEINVYGIDNDSCMATDGRPLNIHYVAEFYEEFNGYFGVELLDELLSDQRVESYREIMVERDMPQEAITWMNYAATRINQQARDELHPMSAMAIFEELETIFNEEHAP